MTFEQIQTLCKRLNASPWQQRVLHEDLAENPWHTGTPTEEGWYLLKLVDEYGRITYDANYLRKGIKGMEWKYAFFGHVIIKWQRIEDEPEVMMG